MSRSLQWAAEGLLLRLSSTKRLQELRLGDLALIALAFEGQMHLTPARLYQSLTDRGFNFKGRREDFLSALDAEIDTDTRLRRAGSYIAARQDLNLSEALAQILTRIEGML